jgi:hypothetical protein
LTIALMGAGNRDGVPVDVVPAASLNPAMVQEVVAEAIFL